MKPIMSFLRKHSLGMYLSPCIDNDLSSSLTGSFFVAFSEAACICCYHNKMTGFTNCQIIVLLFPAVPYNISCSSILPI